MSDQRLRELERAAAGGDSDAQAQLDVWKLRNEGLVVLAEWKRPPDPWGRTETKDREVTASQTAGGSIEVVDVGGRGLRNPYAFLREYLNPEWPEENWCMDDRMRQTAAQRLLKLMAVCDPGGIYPEPGVVPPPNPGWGGW